MNYLFYLDQQLKQYGLFIVATSYTYAILYYFGWIEPILLDESYLIGFISYSFAHVFLVPFYQKYYDSLKGKP